MPEKSNERKRRKNLPALSGKEVEVVSQKRDKRARLSERDFEKTINKTENKVSKRLKGTKLGQR